MSSSIVFTDGPKATPRTFITSKGERIITFLTDAEAAQVLERVEAKDRNEFINTLLRSYRGRKGLSEAQLPWFHKMALDALPPEKRPGYMGPSSEGIPEVVLDLTSVRRMMAKASQHLKRPKIRFQLPEGRVAISIAGSGSRTPGAVMVTDGGPYGANIFYGRVHQDGRWEPRSSGGVPTHVMEALSQMATDHVHFVGNYGRTTGYCCFCGLQLTDKRSTSVGYGPICAENYGLPWG